MLTCSTQFRHTGSSRACAEIARLCSRPPYNKESGFTFRVTDRYRVGHVRRTRGAPTQRTHAAVPNLIPDWLPFMRPAGRLIWFSLFLVVGLLIVVTLIRKPVAKRPFPMWVGIVAYPVIFFATWVLAAIISPIATIIVWLGIFALIGLTLFLCATRKPGVREYTWAEVFIGAVGVFALMTLAYGNIPHEWITFSDSYLLWSTDKLVFHNQALFSIGSFTVYFPPFNMNYQALRDVIAVGLYGAFITLNVVLFLKWQTRNAVPAQTEAAAEKPKRFSRFGRPVKAGA